MNLPSAIRPWLRPLAFLLVASLFAAVALTRLAPPAGAIADCGNSRALDSEELSFLSIINGYRAENTLPPLVASVNLDRSARWYAADLSSRTEFSHTDSLGRGPSGRAADCGYPGPAGENILAGTVRDSGQKAFDLWESSPSHNENMLDADYRQIGIARAYDRNSRYGWYWVTDFGLLDDGTDATAPTRVD